MLVLSSGICLMLNAKPHTHIDRLCVCICLWMNVRLYVTLRLCMCVYFHIRVILFGALGVCMCLFNFPIYRRYFMFLLLFSFLFFLQLFVHDLVFFSALPFGCRIFYNLCSIVFACFFPNIHIMFFYFFSYVRTYVRSFVHFLHRMSIVIFGKAFITVHFVWHRFVFVTMFSVFDVRLFVWWLFNVGGGVLFARSLVCMLIRLFIRSPARVRQLVRLFDFAPFARTILSLFPSYHCSTYIA